MNFALKRKIVEKYFNKIRFLVNEVKIDFIDFVLVDFDNFDDICQEFLIIDEYVNRKCDIFTSEIEN